MGRRRDPIQRRDGDDSDWYGVVDWEPRSLVDRALAFTYSTLSRVGFVILAVGLLSWQLAAGESVATATDPLVVAFICLSVVPALALAAFLWYADVTALQPRLLVVTFLLGVAFVGVAGALNSIVGDALAAYVESHSVATPVALSLVFVLVVAPVEETVKLLAVHVYAYRSEGFDSVLSGAVYGAAAGLGFATVENVFFITEQVSDTGSLTAVDAGGAVATVRALVGPGHVIYSAFAGYYLGLARFNRRYAGPILLKGFLIAVGLHATYNILVSTDAVYLPGVIADVVGVSEIAGVFTFVLAYNGVLISLLVFKLSRYRAAYQETREGEAPESELTEFERGIEDESP
jgi:RsiW-degrading membrane proteinase PrsW (M82 family)